MRRCRGADDIDHDVEAFGRQRESLLLRVRGLVVHKTAATDLPGLLRAGGGPEQDDLRGAQVDRVVGHGQTVGSRAEHQHPLAFPGADAVHVAQGFAPGDEHRAVGRVHTGRQNLIDRMRLPALDTIGLHGLPILAQGELGKPAPGAADPVGTRMADASDQIAFLEVTDLRAQLDNPADALVAENGRQADPVTEGGMIMDQMRVRSGADGSVQRLAEHVVVPCNGRAELFDDKFSGFLDNGGFHGILLIVVLA